MINSFNYSESKPGDEIKIYDNFDCSAIRVEAVAKIEKVQKRFILVRHGCEILKFNKATGLVVGYHWPQTTRTIAPSALS